MAYRVQYKHDINSNWNVAGTTTNRTEAISIARKMKGHRPSLLLSVFDLSEKKELIAL